jgi:hypothetical protein
MFETQRTDFAVSAPSQLILFVSAAPQPPLNPSCPAQEINHNSTPWHSLCCQTLISQCFFQLRLFLYSCLPPTLVISFKFQCGLCPLWHWCCPVWVVPSAPRFLPPEPLSLTATSRSIVRVSAGPILWEDDLLTFMPSSASSSAGQSLRRATHF